VRVRGGAGPPSRLKFEYHSARARARFTASRPKYESRSPSVYNRKINFRASFAAARNGAGSGDQRRTGGAGRGGARGLVSLPQDSNTRRIKPPGNQTFQYPCSCRIYAIKRPPVNGLLSTRLSSFFLLLARLPPPPSLSLSLSLSRAIVLSLQFPSGV